LAAFEWNNGAVATDTITLQEKKDDRNGYVKIAGRVKANSLDLSEPLTVEYGALEIEKDASVFKFSTLTVNSGATLSVEAQAVPALFVNKGKIILNKGSILDWNGVRGVTNHAVGPDNAVIVWGTKETSTISYDETGITLDGTVRIEDYLRVPNFFITPNSRVTVDITAAASRSFVIDALDLAPDTEGIAIFDIKAGSTLGVGGTTPIEGATLIPFDGTPL
jgi:hypothetical protein